MKKDGWKKVFNKILSENDFTKKISQLALDNLDEKDMLDAFLYLNYDELNIEKLAKVSPELSKLILWCQGVVSYHIIIHPFTIRNTSVFVNDHELQYFVNVMGEIINKFYKFKQFINKLELMQIPFSEYVFNLQHSRALPEKVSSASTKLSKENLGNIFSYLSYKEASKIAFTNKKFREGFKESINIMINETLKEIVYTKFQLMKILNRKLPITSYYNMFSDYFLMIDEFVNSEYFFSKEQISDIKNIKLETPIITKIAKIIITMIDEKVEKKVTNTGSLKYMYLERLKHLAVTGALFKKLQSVDKLGISLNKFIELYEDLDSLFSLDKIEQIKKINRGLGQLINWVFLVFEFNKIVNPFDFVSSDYLTNRLEGESLENINHYVLVIKFFKKSMKLKLRLDKNYDLKFFFDKLKEDLIKKNINLDPLFSTNPDYHKITEIYNQTKDVSNRN